METKKIAERLATYCSKGDFKGAQSELFDDNAVSIEPHETPAFQKETKGLGAIKNKGEKFQDMIEKLYGIEVSKPLIAGNSIAFTLAMDVKMRDQDRMATPELCVYKVEDGKIVSEEFFV